MLYNNPLLLSLSTKGIIGGGDNPPFTPKVYKTQAEVDTANALARSFAFRKNYGSNGIDPQETFVARKIGDPVVPYVDSSGKPYVPQPSNMKYEYSVPSEVGPNDIKSDGTFFWYDDPHTGDIKYIHPSVAPAILNQPRFRKDKK